MEDPKYLPINLDTLCDKLLHNQQFLSALTDKLLNSQKSIQNSQTLDQIIEQLSYILEQLIQKKLQNQMSALVEDNNRILQQIKLTLERKSNKIIEGSNLMDTSFTQIHNIISQEKKKAFDRMTDADVEKSMSFMERYEDVVEKINQIQKKVRTMQDRYQTNFKSLWNVLSMTQAAVFDHIKQNKQKIAPKFIQNKQITKDSSFLSVFWK